MTPRSAGKVGYIVIALGSNVHIFARPDRRGELAHCFETVLGSPVRTVEFPGIDQPMLIVSLEVVVCGNGDPVQVMRTGNPGSVIVIVVTSCGRERGRGRAAAAGPLGDGHVRERVVQGAGEPGGERKGGAPAGEPRRVLEGMGSAG